MNSFEWRTVAVIIRDHLGLSRPISTERARNIVVDLYSGARRDPELLAKINAVRS